MTLPPAAPQRQLKHRRHIDVQVFARGNGLWEGDAVLSDVKNRWMPYPGACKEHGHVDTALVGLNLLRNFRAALRERVGGVLGCTHITELAQALPTAVVQAFAGDVIDTRGHAEGADQPFQIDRCHALRSDGAVVREYHPRWYRPAKAA